MVGNVTNREYGEVSTIKLGDKDFKVTNHTEILQWLSKNGFISKRYIINIHNGPAVICENISVLKTNHRWLFGSYSETSIVLDIYFTEESYNFFNGNKTVKSLEVDLLNEDLSNKSFTQYNNLDIVAHSLNLSYSSSELLTFTVKLVITD